MDEQRPRLVLPRGTLLNTATVAVGGLLGVAAGANVPDAYQAIALSGLGLVTVGLGIKMFLLSKNILIVAAAIALGGVLGLFLGIHEGLESFADWAKAAFGGQNPGRFTEAVITTSILFCVGPMTLLGCMQDALEDKIELLAIKSTLDGFAAFFFAAALGPGVLVTAGVVLVVQSILTFSARPLRGLAQDEGLISEITAAGGVMLMGTGLGLLEIKTDLEVANYLPALFLAPLLVTLSRAFTRTRQGN